MKKYFATLIGDKNSTCGQLIFGIGTSRSRALREANEYADTTEGRVTDKNSATVEITELQYNAAKNGKNYLD
mgnify:CR=1 FL=1